MPNYDEITNLILNVSGRDDVDKLRVAIATHEEALKKLIITNGLNDVAVRRSAQTLQTLRDQLRDSERALATSSASTRNYGQSALFASYAFQDFTSVQGSFAQQLSSVQNNLPQLIASLGGGPGLAGMISVVSVGIGLAIPKITSLIKELDLFGESAGKAKGEIERLGERIKVLEKQPILLAVDMLELDAAKAKLDQLKKDQAAFNALKEGKTTFEKEAGDQFKQEYEGMGDEGEQVANKVRSQISKEMTDQVDAATGKDLKEKRKKAADLEAQVSAKKANREFIPPQLEQDTRIARTAADKAEESVKQSKLAITQKGGEAERRTGGLFAGAFAGNDPAKRNELLGRLNKVGGDGAWGLANSLALSTPEEMEAQNDVENAGQANDDAWRGGGKINRQRRHELERKAELSAVEDENIRRQRAQGNGLDDAVRIFPKGGGPGGGGGGGAGGGGIGPMGVGPGGDPRIDDNRPTLGRKAGRPKTIEGRTALNAKKAREAREAKQFRAEVRNAAKRRKLAAPGQLAAPAPPRGPAAPGAGGGGGNDAAAAILAAKQAQLEYVQMQNLMYAAQMEAFMGVWGQARQQLQMIQARQNAGMRQQMQDNDAFMGNGR